MHSTDQSTFELLLRYGVQGRVCVFVNKDTISGLQIEMLRFQNEYNKVEIALRVGQFWSEIKRVITKSHDRVAGLPSTQCNYHYVIT